MKLVKDIMTTKVITLAPDTEVTQAAKILLENHINGAPVVDEGGKILGILCQSDLITAQKRFPLPSIFTLLDGLIPLRSQSDLEKELSKMAAVTVEKAMTTKVVTVSPNATVEDAATLMVEKKFHTLPVVDGKKLVGILGKEDILKVVAG
ncbi:MAG: CBS domain-containing protein [Desulfatibacillaceae bacterium]|nr:CBS domain-containing protein [Desulfatibacillaceae bacterium]